MSSGTLTEQYQYTVTCATHTTTNIYIYNIHTQHIYIYIHYCVNMCICKLKYLKWCRFKCKYLIPGPLSVAIKIDQYINAITVY
jgi:hypothetical protein